MEYFTETGSTHREAIEKVRARWGDAAQILTQRSVRQGGVFGLFAREAIEVTGYVRQVEAKEAANKALDLAAEKRKLLETIERDRALERVLEEVRSIKESMVPAARPEARDEEHPTLARVRELLELNDFSERYREELLERARSTFPLRDLDDERAVEDAVIEWIGDDIVLAAEPEARAPRVLVLVGPTGVGKTTTIAKLAAVSAIGIGGQKPLDTRMITIDNYRIGARQQIETYGSIMGVPVSSVETADDLRKTIAMYREAELVLVDTIGKSPRDSVKLAEMREILAACGPGAEVHLAVAATTKTRDMLEIMRQFEPFGYGAVVVTKLDETDRVGNVLSALRERGKPVSWLADGQRVPQDIARASVERFLINLEGFAPNRPKIEERYAARENRDWRP
ncbi:MAG TPA: flagellar biosynthesis protein FlhF [Spirochaetales bacterium]|nr:flagellar biosynthesis protein FlhF [Spirochaetales bacterium]